jgi:hypothetical protein
MVTSAGQPCDSANDAYAASWISGVTQDATLATDALVSFNDYCVPIGGGDPLAEGVGLAEYDPATNTLDSQVTVFTSTGGQPLASQEVLGSPVFSGRWLYLFGPYCNETYDATCISNSANAVYLARVPADPAALANPGDYQWYAGPSAWTPTAGGATSLFSGAIPLAVTVNDFSALGQGLVLIEQTNDVGGFTVYQTSRPSAAWNETMSGTVSLHHRRR